MGVKRGLSFLVTLLTVATVAVSVLYAGSSVYGEEDTTPPDTQITAGPSGTVDCADVTFSWTGWDDTTPVSGLEYSFSLQGYETEWSDWAPATTRSYSDLPGGRYTFSVRARDQAGNADPTAAETAFYVSWSFAVLTDLHIGREFADYDGPGWNDSGTPISGEAAGYARDAVNEVNKIADSQNIAFVAVLGDMTNQAELSQLRSAKLIFDDLTVPWIPVIGNHDGWPMTDNTEAPDCCPPPDSYFDSIMGPEYAKLASEMSGWGKESPAMVYDPERERDAYFENFFFDYGGFHFVFLDLNRDGWRAGELHDFSGGTWSWFRQHMEQFVQTNPERSRDVILLAHHPMRDDGLSGASTFTAAELDQISSFTRNTSYSYVDSSGITQTRPYSSRIWGQLAGHTHPYRLQVDYPAWSDGGPVVTYPRNFGNVQVSVIKVTSDTPTGVDYSRPTAATEAATNVSSTSATLNGYVASRGTAASVQVSFEWGPTTDYGNATTPQANSAGSFSASVSGLTPGTTYHFRAEAAGNGTAYGSDMTFTTNTTLHVTTSPADSISATSATLNGYLDSLGTATSVNVSFEWGKTTAYGNATTPQAMTGSGTFSAGISGLTPATTYHFRAKAAGNATAYGEDMTIGTIDPTAPSVPTLLSPSNGAVVDDNTPFLDWSTVIAATTVHYRFQLDNNADFSSPLISKTWVTWSYLTLKTLADGKYYWRVGAVDAKGSMSAWTAGWSFTIDTVGPVVPPVPTLISPANGASIDDSTPLLDWSTVTATSLVHYRLQVDNNADFSTPLINETWVESSSFALSTALPDGVYYWRVSAVDAEGSMSAWTAGWSFTIDTAGPVVPPVPTLIFPANGASIDDSTPLLDWSTVTATSLVHYRLQVDNNADFSTPLINETWVESSSFAVSTALPDGVYYWKVSAVDAEDSMSAWTTSWSFVIDSIDTGDLSVPTLVSPSNGAFTSDTTPFLDWSTVKAATAVHYRLQVDNNADFSSPLISKSWVSWSYVTLNTLPSGKYYWRVSAVDAEGKTSAWTDGWSFTIA